MGQYDIYLDGEGYHLAKGPDGQLLSGAAQERKVNPFTRFLGTEEQYQRTPFLFGDGCGLFMYDGSHKYSTAYDVDTRSGRLTIGPKHELCDGPSNTEWIVIDPSYLNAEQLKLGSGQEGLAVRFQAAAGKTGIRSVAVLVKRKSTTNYDTAVNFNIGIDNDAAGPKPGGGATYIATSLKYDDAVDYPWPDRWRGDDYFWVEAIFTAAHAITAGNYYWIQVTNLQAPEVYWAENTVIGSATRSHGLTDILIIP
jgi:hypothetical protein